MEQIIIEQKQFGFNVKQGDKSALGLGYDEMLGLVSALTMPEKCPCLQWMKTEEQRESFKRFLKKKRSVSDKVLRIEDDNTPEAKKCKEYIDLLHEILRGNRVDLKEKVWVKTEKVGYEFSACHLIDFSDQYLEHIEVYDSNWGIHCNARLLNSKQLKEIVLIVNKSVIP